VEGMLAGDLVANLENRRYCLTWLAAYTNKVMTSFWLTLKSIVFASCAVLDQVSQPENPSCEALTV
jgi:hypothetical protein